MCQFWSCKKIYPRLHGVVRKLPHTLRNFCTVREDKVRKTIENRGELRLLRWCIGKCVTHKYPVTQAPLLQSPSVIYNMIGINIIQNPLNEDSISKVISISNLVATIVDVPESETLKQDTVLLKEDGVCSVKEHLQGLPVRKDVFESLGQLKTGTERVTEDFLTMLWLGTIESLRVSLF